MADITGSITKIRTSDNSEHYINAKYWDGHEWGELASALKYCGITTTELTDGATTNPVVIGDTNHTATAGCVVFYEDTEGGKSTTKEFVFNGSKWELLGADSTYKVVQSTVSSPNADGSAMAFIDTISQDANGVITVTKKYCKKQYRLEYTATESLGNLDPCIYIDSVFHEYDTSTGKGAFVYEKAPNKIVIMDSAFRDCTSLTSITIPDIVTNIGNYAFEGCSNLTSVIIGNSVTSIGYEAFAYCGGLTSIKIPDSVISIGDYAFQSCTSLTSVTIPDGVTSIENNAFYRCYSLKNITIPDSVTSIGNEAFAGCSMKSITIPDSVTSIGWSAFTGCSELTNITIGRGVTEIGLTVITSCDNLKTVYCKPTTPPSLSDPMLIEMGIKTYVPIDSVDAYKTATYWSDFPDHIIGCVFEDENLVSGENIKTINGESILGKGNIELNIELGSKNFPSDDELWYTSPMGETYIPDDAFGSNQIISHTYENGIGVIRFKEILTEIADGALNGNPDIVGVYIPEKVTYIGRNAFNIESLTDVFMGPETAPELYDGNVFGNWDAVVNSLKIWIPVDEHDSYMGNEVWHYYWESFRPYIKGGENLISGKNIATINGAYIIGDHNFNLVSKSNDGYVDESLTPKYTSLSLGSSSKPWNTVYANTITADGVINISSISGRDDDGYGMILETYNGGILMSSIGDIKMHSGESNIELTTSDGWVIIESSEDFNVTARNIEISQDGCYATAFYETSDENLKDFTDDITVDFNKLKEIRKSYFTWKDGDQNLHIGTSAQDIQKVYPELVSEDNKGNLTVDYAKLSIIALSAIDKLDERLSRIENILNKEE